MMKHFRAFVLALAVVLSAALQTSAANKKETVSQVTTTVNVDGDVDYIVTSATPFAGEGVVNIVNTGHAVLILQAVKPSKAASLLASRVLINGEKAIDGVNCQLKLYNRGSIVMPYENSLKPLTVFSEKNFQGESCSDFGLENSNGFMNTLTDRKLNNRIRSFKLKRGYMVTFSTLAGGRGYSRCFIAADQDKEISSLPSVLDQKISSYRVFKWYDTGKVALAAAAGDVNACSALNVTSTYSWNEGTNMHPDIEVVPHQIYSGYPSASACGSVNYSPHMKTSNEPRNGSDDHPEDLAAILNNWESLMATGMRLCTPSSWDGSDYWNGTGFLKTFIDSIDARGWRCDIIDMHCYWEEGSFPNLVNWKNATQRPIWISEWCWGASWNNNGAFKNGVTEEQVKDALERICNNLNGYDYVERYFYWNGERDPTHIYSNGLTPAGEMYAKLDGGVGYNGKYDYVPRNPRQYNPANLKIEFDKSKGVAHLMWYEYNGEQNNSMVVERRKSSNGMWTTVLTPDQKETAADYEIDDTEAVLGYEYRIKVVDLNNEKRYSNIVMASSDELGVGDAIQVKNEIKYLGGNMLYNGDFSMGTYGWKNGIGGPLEQPWFQVVPVGGMNNGAYLQAYGTGTQSEVASVMNVYDLQENTDYYFSAAMCNMGSGHCRVAPTTNGTIMIGSFGTLSNTTADWQSQFMVFNTGSYSKAIVAMLNLSGTAQLAQLKFCRLFDTIEEALADGETMAQHRVEAFKAYNTLYPQLNEGWDDVDEAIAAYNNMRWLNTYIEQGEKVLQYQLFGTEALQKAINTARQAVTASEVNQATATLKQTLEEYMSATDMVGTVKNPSFANVDGWITKCGTYTGGDQRSNNSDGKTFWNAWWSGISASEGTAQTMAVKQEISGLDHGLYALECKATTEHYCLSDQHAFISVGEQKELSPALTADYFDLPTVSAEDRWQTMTTIPVYVDDESTLTIGFEGSKQGAIDNAWHRLGNPNNTGDKREGWWCATDFVLKHIPLYRTTVEPQQWRTCCLPYALHSSQGVKFYQIVAMTSDFENFCLEEIEEVEAGMPFIYRAEQSDVSFLEYGEPAQRALVSGTPGNLRGFFKTTVKAPVGYYYLNEGQWVKIVDSSSRPLIGNYSAIMRPLTDSGAQPIAIVEQWDGPTIPIVGMTDAEKAVAGIDGIPVSTHHNSHTYDLQGRRVANGQTKAVVIKNGKKIIK